MRAFDAVQIVIAKLTALIAQARQWPDFACGECERREQCALPPSNRCVVMAAQIERNGGRSVKRPILPQY
ncbi:MAG TPA: hypothetical protein VH397_19500 [Xanthobacteraceae bacterium]|jgi:hypothetical protein